MMRSYQANFGPSCIHLLGYSGNLHISGGIALFMIQKEDPFEDMKHLEAVHKRSMLVITSAGDNALHYATEKGTGTVCNSIASSLDISFTH